MKNILWLALVAMLTITSCQALSRRDPLLTLEAESISYAAEATTIYQTAQFERTSLSVTAQAAETGIALVNGVNQQLRATLSVQVTPTINLGGGGDFSVNPTLGVGADGTPVTENATRYVLTGTSTATNSADGCVINPQPTFPADVSFIYATAQAFNLKAGTVLRSEWLYENTPRYDFEWVVDQDYPDLCIWFYIDPTITQFTPGGWRVQLLANGSPIENGMQFMIEAPMTDGQ